MLSGEGTRTVLSILVRGIGWYAAADGELYALPAETVVGLPRVLAAAAGGTIAHLLLPEGTAALPRRALPLRPLPIDRVFPLGAAELPWEPDPERAPAGVVVLGHGWHLLFRERKAFSAWGGDADAPLLEAFRRRFGPRPQFRESHDRRTIGVKFPQLLEPHLVYRLNEHARALPDPARYAPVMAIQDRVRLVELEAGRVVEFGPGEFGWAVRSYAGSGEAAVGRSEASELLRAPADLEAFLQPRGAFWRLEPAPREARLVIPG